MEFQKLIEERRTIRKYSPEGKITKDELLTIIRGRRKHLAGRTPRQEDITV